MRMKMNAVIMKKEGETKIYAILEPKDNLDKAIWKIKRQEGWKLVKRGRKYLEFEKKTSLGVVKVRVEKKRFENFNINNIDWKITITKIEPFMHSTYVLFVGKREKCLSKLEELKKEYKDIEVEEWKI